jgi:hypothetical protein
MVGTPSNTVARLRWTTSRTAAASNLGTSDMVPPRSTQVFMMLDSPKMWNGGSATTTTSSSLNSNNRPGISAFMYSVTWDSTAPFGTPVVPEV